MQAKKKLYFMPANEDEPPMPFMLKNDLRVMIGVRTTRPGYHSIEHNDENFRFFVPVDMLEKW
jgi:hypothetical protein